MFQTMVDAYNLSLCSAHILVLTADSSTLHLAKNQDLQDDRLLCLLLPVLHKHGRTAWTDIQEKRDAYRDLIHVALAGRVMGAASLLRSKLFCLPEDKRTGLRLLPISVKFQTTYRKGVETHCNIRRFTEKQNAKCVKYVEEKFSEVAALLQNFSLTHKLLQVDNLALGPTALEVAGWLPGGARHDRLKNGSLNSNN